MSGSEITDITVLILRDIRDRLDGTNERLDGLAGDVRGTNERLETLTRQVHVMTERVSLLDQTVKVAVDKIGAVGRIVKNRHETAIDDLRERVTRLEAKARGEDA